MQLALKIKLKNAFPPALLNVVLLRFPETIGPNLSNGGCILFNDYLAPEFKGAKQDVDIFVEKYQAEISEQGLLNRLYYVRKV